MKKKTDDKGVPRRKNVGSSSAVVPSAKTQTASRTSDPSREERHYPKVGTCEACRWWRDKGWGSASSGIGICDNPKVDIRLGMGSHFMVDFCKMDPRDAKAVENSIRFPNSFGCIFHEEAPWMRKEVALGIVAAAKLVRSAAKDGTRAKPGRKAATPK